MIVKKTAAKLDLRKHFEDPRNKGHLLKEYESQRGNVIRVVDFWDWKYCKECGMFFRENKRTPWGWTVSDGHDWWNWEGEDCRDLLVKGIIK